MAQYQLTIQTRRLYPGPEESSFAEAYAAHVFADYDDEDDCVVTIGTDKARENIPIDINDQDHDGPVDARMSVMAVPSEGLGGTSFDVKIVKTVPTTGDFSYHRTQLKVIPGNIDTEHVAGGGTSRTGAI